MKSKFNLIYEDILKETSKYDYSKSNQEYQIFEKNTQQKYKQLWNEYYPKFKQKENQIVNKRYFELANEDFNNSKSYRLGLNWLSRIANRTTLLRPKLQEQLPEIQEYCKTLGKKLQQIDQTIHQAKRQKQLQELQVRNKTFKQKFGQITPYKDFLDNQIKIGDFILISKDNRLCVGKVINFSNKSITIQKALSNWQTADTVSYIKAEQIHDRVIISNNVKLNDKQKQLFGVENQI